MLSDDQRLERLVGELARRHVSVEFLSEDDEERVTIAQLRDFRIVINPSARDTAGSIFTIAHLFGHLIQFTNFERYQHLTERVEGPKPLLLDDQFKQAFYAYEREAFGYGKTLMQVSFPISAGMERQYGIFMETDFAHFWHFITTGKQGDVESFNALLLQNYRSWGQPVPNIPLVPLPDTLELRHSVCVNVS